MWKAVKVGITICLFVFRRKSLRFALKQTIMTKLETCVTVKGRCDPEIPCKV
jgi:hypothetical protein